MKVNTDRDTFQRQMGAVIAKLLNDIEELQTIRTLHPFDLDKLRKRCIKAAWDCYVVGLNKGTNGKAMKDESIHSTERRAIDS
jgi:hypothetical protein